MVGRKHAHGPESLLRRGIARCCTVALITGALFPLNMWAQPAWQKTNGPMSSHVNAIAVDTDGTIFAGTFREGVFRSSDGGESWEALGLTGTNIRDIVIDVDGRLFVGTFGVGVYRSSDQGETWQETNIGLFDPRVQSLDTDASGTVVAGTFGSGVFALDGGIAWRWASEGLTDYNVRGVSINSRGLWFAACRGDGVFVSDDEGLLWTRMEGSQPLSDLRTITTHGNAVLVGGWVGGVARTYVGEGAWEKIDEGLPNSKVWSLLVITDGRLLAGTHTQGVLEWDAAAGSWRKLGLDGSIVSKMRLDVNGDVLLGVRTGIYRAAGNSASWRLLGIPRSYVYSLARTESGALVAATFDGGLLRTEDRGGQWIPSNINFESVFSVVSDAGRLFAGAVFGHIYRSDDDGRTWQRINESAGGSGTRESIWSLHVNGDRIFAGSTGDGVVRSLDGGSTWSRAGLESQYVWTLSSDEDGTLFAGTEVGMYRSRDDGDSWEDLTTAHTSVGVYSDLTRIKRRSS